MVTLNGEAEIESVVEVEMEGDKESDASKKLDELSKVADVDPFLAQIAQAEKMCQMAEESVEEKKGHLKDAKDHYDWCVAHLRKLASEADPASLPLFNQPNEPDDNSQGDDDEGTDESSGDPYAGWESQSIEKLGLPKGMTEKLIDAGAATIGQLENLRGRIYSGAEEWPKGVGEAAVTRIEDAVLAFLDEHQQQPKQGTESDTNGNNQEEAEGSED